MDNLEKRKLIDECEFDINDEIKNTVSDVVGFVSSIFVNEYDKLVLDVRIDDEMKYGTPASNWKLVRKNDDQDVD